MRAPTRRRSTIRGAAVLLLTGLLAGCTSATSGAGADPVGPGPAAAGNKSTATRSGGEIVLPIDAYAFTMPELSQIDRARQVLVRECMRRFGFPYPYDPEQAQQRTENLVKDLGAYGNKRRYGPTDAAAAARYGYHSPSDVDGTSLKIDVAKEKENGSAAQQMVLTAKAPAGRQVPTEVDGKPLPQGGCVGEAGRRINPTGQLGDGELVSRIPRDSFARSLTDATVTAAFTRWSACMQAKGYRYPTPREAGGEFDTGTRHVAAKEIAAAKADVACKKQSRLLDAWQGYETAFQQQQIDQHAEALQALKADKDAQLRRAAEVVAQGS